MAQFIAGKTKCCICGNAILTTEEIVAIPAFVPKGHVFSSYSDGTFHKDCFLVWEDHEQFKSLYDDYQRIWDSRPRNISFHEMEEWGEFAFAKVFEKGMLTGK